MAIVPRTFRSGWFDAVVFFTWTAGWRTIGASTTAGAHGHVQGQSTPVCGSRVCCQARPGLWSPIAEGAGPRLGSMSQMRHEARARGIPPDGDSIPLGGGDHLPALWREARPGVSRDTLIPGDGGPGKSLTAAAPQPRSQLPCLGGGIGRRARFRSVLGFPSGGSTPLRGTRPWLSSTRAFFYGLAIRLASWFL